MAAPWPRPIDEYCLPAASDVAAWLAMSRPFSGSLHHVSLRRVQGGSLRRSGVRAKAAGAARFLQSLYGTCFGGQLLRAYLLYGLHWRVAWTAEGPPDSAEALFVGDEKSTGFSSVLLRRDVRGRRGFEVSLEKADDDTLRVLVVKVPSRDPEHPRTIAFLADSVAEAARWDIRLRQRAAPAELFFLQFPLGHVGECGTAAAGGAGNASEVPQPRATAALLDGLSEVTAQRDALTSAAQVLAILVKPAAAEAVAAAGPAVALVVGTLLNAARLAVRMAGLRSELLAAATKTAALFDLLWGGLGDLLRALLAADDPPVPDSARHVLTRLFASLVDRLEAVACTITSLAHSRQDIALAGGTSRGGAADMSPSLAAMRVDIHTLLVLISARNSERLVRRQEDVLAVLACSNLGSAPHARDLLSRFGRLVVDLDATATRATHVVDELDRKAAVEQKAVDSTLESYAALLAPPAIDEGVVIDWSDPLRAECRIYEALLKTTSCLSAVGVSGMGGLGKSTALRLVCARLAADKDGIARFLGKGGGILWVQLHRDVHEAEAAALLLQAACHLTGRLVSGTGVTQAAKLLGGAAVKAAQDGRPWLIVLDDVWDGRLLAAVQAAMRPRCDQLAPSGRSVLIFTTRMASMAATDDASLHVVLDRISDEHSLQVLVAAVSGTGGERPLRLPWARNASERRAAAEIISFADGHPLTLCVAGAIARKHRTGDDNGLSKALARLRVSIQSVHGHLGASYSPRYESLWASLLVSYECLTSTGRAQYRSLAVMRTKGRLSPIAMAALWGVDVLAAGAIADSFVDASMASLRAGPVAGVGTAEECLQLHDIQLHFVRELCAPDPVEVAQAHDMLLQGYARFLNLKPADARAPFGGEAVRDIPWWSGATDDAYLRDELCRHLHGAGRIQELRLLLHTWPYVRVRAGLSSVIGHTRPSTGPYRADCELDPVSVDVALVVERAALRGGTRQVAFELHACFHDVSIGTFDSGRSALMRRLLEGMRAGGWGPDLRVAAPQTILEPSRQLRTFPNVADDEREHWALGTSASGVRCMASLPLSQHPSHVAKNGALKPRVAVCGEDGNVRVFDVNLGRATSVLRGQTGRATCIAAVSGGDSDGDSVLVVTGSSDGTLSVWAVDQAVTAGDHQAPTFRMSGHTKAVVCVEALTSYTSEATTTGAVPALVASGSDDGTIRIWDVRCGSSVDVLRSEPDDRIKLILAVGGRCEEEGAGNATRVRLAAVVSQLRSCDILLVWRETAAGWSVESRQSLEWRGVKFLAVLGREADEDGEERSRQDHNRIVIGTLEEGVYVWDLDARCEVKSSRLSRCRALLGAGVLVPPAGTPLDGSGASFTGSPMLVCGLDSGGVATWDTSRASFYPPVRGHSASVTSIVAIAAPPTTPSATGGPCRRLRRPSLVSGAIDGTLCVWDASFVDSGSSRDDGSGSHTVSVLAAGPIPCDRCDDVIGNDVSARLPNLFEGASSQARPSGRPTAGCSGAAVWYGRTDGSIGVRRWAMSDSSQVLHANGKALTALTLVGPLFSRSRQLENDKLKYRSPHGGANRSSLDYQELHSGPSRRWSISGSTLRQTLGFPIVFTTDCDGVQAWHLEDHDTSAVHRGRGSPATPSGIYAEKLAFPLSFQAVIAGDDAADQPSSPLLVSLVHSGSGIVWDVRGRKAIAQLHPPHIMTVWSLAIVGVEGCGSDMRMPRVVAATDQGNLVVWDAQSGRHLHTLRVHDSLVCGMAAVQDAPDAEKGRFRLVFAASGSEVSIWNVDAGRRVATVSDGTSDITCFAAVACSGATSGAGGATAINSASSCIFVVAAAEDQAVRVWNVGTETGGVGVTTPTLVHIIPVPGVFVRALHLLDASRGLLLARLVTGVTVLDFIAGTVVAQALLGVDVADACVVGPRAVACLVDGEVVQLELDESAGMRAI